MSIRRFLERNLENPKFHLFIVTLIVIDIILVFIELLLERIYVCTCPSHPPEFVFTLGHIFLGYTYFMLGLFALEMIAKFWVFGFQYFKDPWHLFDVIFIAASIIVNVMFNHIWNVGFGLILGRVFRIVRFGHGVAETTEQEAEKRLHSLERQLLLQNEELLRLRRSIGSSDNVD